MQNTGTLVTAAIRPNDTLDKIASAYAVEIKGGMHSYETLLDMKDVIVERREWGMLANVYLDPTPGNNTTWQLKYGAFNTDITENKNWVKFSASAGAGGGSAYWIDPVLSISENQPGSPASGDRYILGPTPSGVDWGALTKDTVVEWDVLTTTWRQTTPLESMSVRVIDQGNSIYKWNSTDSVWVKENLNQVVRLSATSSNAISYTSTNTSFLDYNSDALYVVNFATANSGTNVTLDVNGKGARTVWQQTNYGTASFSGKDININVDYTLQYDGSNFRLSKPNSDPTFVKYRILPNETVVVPAYQEYLLYGDLEVNGSLNIDPLGKVVVINGALNVNGGTVSNSGNVQLINLATNVAAVAVKKFSTTISLTANVAYNIVHNLNSNDITVSAWDEATYEAIVIDVDRGSSNDINVTSIISLSSVRVVVMG